MKRILLTGATGFIGRHCLPLLTAEGDEVHAISRVRKNGAADQHQGGAAALDGPLVSWHQLDVLDARQTKDLIERVRPTHLLHLAWVTTPGEYWSSLENLEWVRASIELFRRFGEQGGRKVVAVGSCAEYDWRHGPCSESQTPLMPATLYGTCKNSLQQMLTSLAERMNFSAAWGRIFFVYGPHEHQVRLIPSVISSLLEGKPAHCTDGAQLRDFLYVKDVASALVALLHSDLSGPINIASGQPLVVRDVVNTIGRKMGAEDLIRLGTLEKDPQEPALLVGDTTRLEHELKWRPQYSLDSGLDLTIDWWQQSYAQSALSIK